MYHAIYKSLSATTTPELSRAVQLEIGNAVRIDCTIFDNSSGNPCSVYVEGSNDLQNWQDLTGFVAPIEESAPGHYSSGIILDLGTAYVRLRHVVATAGHVTCSTGIEVFDQ